MSKVKILLLVLLVSLLFVSGCGPEADRVEYATTIKVCANEDCSFGSFTLVYVFYDIPHGNICYVKSGEGISCVPIQR